MKRSLVGLIFMSIACVHLPPEPDAGALQLNLVAQPLVVVVAGGSATLDVTVSSLTSNNDGPAFITITPLPSGLTTTPITWTGEPKITFTISASADAPVSELHASIAATIDTVSAGTATTTIEVSSADGALDPTFGTNGFVTLPFTVSADAFAFASTSSDQWIVGGEFDASHGMLARVNADGTFDSSFALDSAIDPVVSASVSADGDILALTTSGAVVVDATGHVLPALGVGGQFGAWDGQNGFLVGDNSFFHFDGSLQVTSSQSVTSPTALVVQQDTAFVGVANTAPTIQKWSSTSPGLYAPDATFSPYVPNGIAALAIDASDRLLAASAGPTLSLTRFLQDGTLDLAFGASGIVQIDSGETATLAPKALFVQPSGKIVVVALLTSQTVSQGIMLARVNDDGSPDPGFGAYGRTKTELSHPLDVIGAGYDATTKRICTASDVPTSISSIEMACYHIEP